MSNGAACSTRRVLYFFVHIVFRHFNKVAILVSMGVGDAVN